MALKIFFYISLFLSIIFYFLPIESLKDSMKKEDRAIFIFENPTMYTLDEESLSKKIVSKQAVKYKTRDELYFADINIYNKDIKKEFNKENLKAEFIEKKGEKYYLSNRVKYKRDEYIKFNTNELFFDNTKKIARNTQFFDAMYYDNFYSGTNLYFDMNTNYIKSRRTHFIIEPEKKDKK
ncbi:Lipopolysaccharide-assembly, LptC-like protein [Aliarcobacter thereius]|uniref:Lipopolysaccharide-assembly, LptC-like protein n=2 Tax=Aliarcobacter thereius TaxID=544718 RepID=A0A1C0B661_9BACT|nr:LPS export ABC transporter periplasmic protein LptC [Aliarcobacter thereius]OCL86348.1 Lipopolysaccharide-assembly, LptC-like protein [Aliarcobacter thereius]OCL90034.1 Lipopolysaccharide-assembly, LptC-like protein [Aliarcobacter thereius]OCL96366.1 Lipopolysaccharide-assembly, LptC-like protein [Aliarcobacter thereius LMG 24486]OCL98673.1 Lipopolysaccharide-assembly, LptC-like protein [Aliarcobacter thereius]QBF15672.1 putative lipooligosaccharide transport system, OM component LptC [Alia